jgi:hypothetical protein
VPAALFWDEERRGSGWAENRLGIAPTLLLPLLSPSQHSPPPSTTTMLSAHPQSPHLHPPPPSRASLKTWWNHFTFVQRAKKDSHFVREWEKGPSLPRPPPPSPPHPPQAPKQSTPSSANHSRKASSTPLSPYRLQTTRESFTSGVTCQSSSPNGPSALIPFSPSPASPP